MDMYPREVKKWKCEWYGCGELYDSEREAVKCLYNHVKERAIELDFDYGHRLGYINSMYGMGWELSNVQKEITKYRGDELKLKKESWENAFSVCDKMFANHVTSLLKRGKNIIVDVHLHKRNTLQHLLKSLEGYNPCKTFDLRSLS